MNRRLLAALVAAVLALAGGTIVIFYARGADSRAQAGSQPAQVWVSTAQIPAGTSLKEAEEGGLLTRTTVPSTAVPAGALGDITHSEEPLVALSGIAPGEYLLAARFGTTPTGERAIVVPPGRLAVSVELSDPARAGSFITPGSHIAIFSTQKVRALGDDAAAKALNDSDIQQTVPLLTDVLVIAMGDSPLVAPKGEDEPAAASDAASFLVTVAVTPADAAKLIHAVNNYKLYAALRGDKVKIDSSDQASDLSLARQVLR